ncbi:phosphohydrolase [Tepiditoga spiralis]|uniref:Phosphohydrolase n=1 Tax=Tepiditoga spiralis TaxID=2108365 RepID=A0A7G1G398_9BACT|nr:HD domain-containing protein [Tepiditoga spiralis]BBE30831.1 phosphohydrolase [Tepiditoga spiralis]
MDYIKKTYEFIKKEISFQEGSHNLDHTLRVLKNAVDIQKKEGGDYEIIVLSTLLHDIARNLELSGKISCHAEEGAKISKKFLREIGYEKYEEVAYCIKTHRYKKGIIPQTLEARILQDADRLDALGRIGVVRTLIHDSNRPLENSINHFYEKILKLKDTMNTKTAKNIAEKKHNIVLEFVKGLEEELNNKYTF